MLHQITVKKQLHKTRDLIENSSIWFAGLLIGLDEPWPRS